MNTGGPAFPWCGDLNECPTINLGMTLRDYFAAKAMQALMSRNDRSIATTREFIGETAYEYADLMLKAREQ